MYRLITSLLVCALTASTAASLLEPESDFFGMPGVDSLSMDWFLDKTDSAEFGFLYPVDIEVLRLSSSDYRVVVLDGGGSLLTFPMEQRHIVANQDIIRTEELPGGCLEAATVCQVRSPGGRCMHLPRIVRGQVLI